MSRPFWHWQAGLEVAVDTARHQLDHAVRVEMKLATARARPVHHMPQFRSLGWLAARRTASPAHRSPTSYKVRKRGPASAPSIEAPGVEYVMDGRTAAPCRRAVMHQRKCCRGLHEQLTCSERLNFPVPVHRFPVPVGRTVYRRHHTPHHKTQPTRRRLRWAASRGPKH